VPPAKATAGPDPQALNAVIAEIQELKSLDPAGQEQLLANLRQTPPDLWPLVVQQFRAAIAYRRQVEERDRLAQRSGGAGPASEPAVAPASTDPHLATGPPGLSSGLPAPAGDSSSRASRSQDSALPLSSSASSLPGGSSSRADDSRGTTPAGAKTAAAPTTGCPGGLPAAAGGPIKAASYEPQPSKDWQVPLNEAIRGLEAAVNPTPQSAIEIAQHARLRMLYLLAGRREDALRPIPSISPSMQDFWSKQIFGLATLLDTEQIAEPTRRAGEAERHLIEAIARLGEASPLVVKNLAFVTEVQSFGAYKPFAKNEFVPGQRLLLYAEVDNFKSNETPKGCFTALQSSYQILDSRGQRVADHEFSANEEYCHNPRRDFFIGYEFVLPKHIYPGKHILQLTVTDLNSQKIGQSNIEFTITE
jgi:hypothetical protein